MIVAADPFPAYHFIAPIFISPGLEGMDVRKLKLSIQDLAVESFPVTAAAAAPVGTVHGREEDGAAGPVPVSLKIDDTCLTGVCTCWYSCDGHDTCGATGRITACTVDCPAAGEQPARQPL